MLDKRFKTVFFYLFLAVKSEELFNFKLNGQTVGIPTCLARNHIAFHCAVTRNHILDNAGQDVTYMRLAVRGRRAVIKYVWCAFGTAVNTFFKYLFVFPEFFYFLFFLYKIEVRRYFFIHLFLLLSK